MGAIAEYLEADHERLHALLDAARAEGIPREPYDAFRRGLLRHIGIEEKLLFPEARKAGATIPHDARLRKDHGRLTALLVPTPTEAILAEIAGILAAHDPLEDGPHGVYAACEHAIGQGVGTLAAKMAQFPEPPLRPNYDGRLPKVLEPG